MTSLLPLSGSVVLSALAQISLRHGASMSKDVRSPRAWPWFALWGSCFAVATVLWIMALRRADISYAYPLLGSGYVLVTVLARWILRERVTALRWIAVLIITAGVVMVGVNR